MKQIITLIFLIATITSFANKSYPTQVEQKTVKLNGLKVSVISVKAEGIDAGELQSKWLYLMRNSSGNVTIKKDWVIAEKAELEDLQATYTTYCKISIKKGVVDFSLAYKDINGSYVDENSPNYESLKTFTLNFVNAKILELLNRDLKKAEDKLNHFQNKENIYANASNISEEKKEENAKLLSAQKLIVIELKQQMENIK